MPSDISDLPETVQRVLGAFVSSAREVLSTDLQAVVLYGSAAEGRLRSTSDVNLILVLHAFRPERVDKLREASRAAHASIRLDTMFLLEAELGDAVEAFAVKFADILKRRRVLFGSDPFEHITLSRAAELLRLRQVLLNLSLRLRRQYVMSSLREEQAALAIAEATAPIRAAAAVLLTLQGAEVESPRAALAAFVHALKGEHWAQLLEQLSEARERRPLPAGGAPRALLSLLDLLDELRKATNALGQGSA